MLIGKTSLSISKTEIFEKYSETQVISAVFPEIKSIPCKISSPFRVDKNPSFGIFMGDDNHIYYKDFGDSTEKGSLLDLLCKYWKCTFNQCLDRICKLMSDVEGDSLVIKPKQIKTLTRKEVNDQSKLEVKIRPWRDYDIEYWKSYGISLKWLKYANVFPVAYKIITKEGKKYVFTADKYCYAYTETKEGILSIKVYSPFNTKGFKWCSKMSDGVISLWTKIPEKGDKVVICSSVKDALCLSANLHIPAIAPQGEGYSISKTAQEELKRRYKKVFICFDVDAPGLKDAEKLSEETGFPYIVPNLGTEKDLSDAFKKYGEEWFVSNIKPLFN